MNAWSILLGVLALVSMGLGVLTTPVPVLGALFSFGAPALALAGAVIGGVSMSRLKREGKPTDGATAGVIVSGLAFIPALLTALTCGVCNALCSAGEVHTQGFQYSVGQGASDGGVGLPPPPPLRPRPQPKPQGAQPQPGAVDPAAPAAEPGARAAEPGAPPPPPPAFPPPPMNP